MKVGLQEIRERTENSTLGPCDAKNRYLIDTRFLLNALGQAQLQVIEWQRKAGFYANQVGEFKVLLDEQIECRNQSQDRERVLREALELLVAFDKGVKGTEHLDLWQVTQQARQALGRRDNL